jgi:inorganic pyrophosphatase
MSIVEENGVTYNIDDETGIVVSAVKSAELVQELDDELRIGDRVEVDNDTGQIVSIVSSVYGPAFGVRFDDGSVDEYVETQLTRTTVEAKEYDSPIQEVFERYESYGELPAYTNDEIERKSAEARWLKLRASSLREASSLAGFGIDKKLDEIVLVTGSDLTGFKEVSERADSPENQEYLSRFNRYSIAQTVSPMGASLGMSGDVSWLDDVDELDVVETTDADLAVRAADVVARLTREQLENNDFMILVASYQHEYLQTEDGNREQKFAEYLERARKERLKELPQQEQKQASTDGLDDAPDAALFL